jgi:hypothetical protein
MNNSVGSNEEAGLAGLMMNFTKLAILLAFALMVILIVHMGIEILGTFDVVVLDVTDSNINTPNGKVNFSYYVAPGFHSGPMKPPQLQVSDANDPTRPLQLLNPESHQKGKPYHFAFWVQSLGRANPEGIYVLKYYVVQGSHHSHEFKTNVDYHIPLHCQDCPPRCGECPHPRPYDMYIVENQWNYLPGDLRRPNVTFTIKLPSGQILSSDQLRERLEWQPGWHLQEQAIECSGRYQSGDNGDFALRILSIENQPPKPLKEDKYVGLAYPRNKWDEPDGLPPGYQNWGFVLDDFIIDPDGVKPLDRNDSAQMRGKRPKADLFRYTLTEQPKTFRLVVQTQATPRPYPYRVYMFGDHWYLVRNINDGEPLGSIPYGQRQLKDTYEEFVVTATDSDGHHSDILIKVFFSR